jgi:uncharacterized protein with FMN-binding domain
MTTDRRPTRIPVRGSLAVVLTAGGLALLLGFRSPQDPATELLVAIGPGDEASPIPEAPAVTAEPSLGWRPANGAGESPTLSPSPSGNPSPTPSPTLSRTSEATPSTLTATGDAVEFRWGAVQVVVTVRDDQIVDVQSLQMPDGDRRSASISQQAEPMLRESALAVDGADIDVISGATYTSLAYANSLQSALDQLAAG